MESVTGWWVAALIMAVFGGVLLGADLIATGMLEDCQQHGQMTWGGTAYKCEAMLYEK